MIVLQLLLYCLLFTAMVKIAVIGGAVNGLYFYPKEVQDRAIELGLIDRNTMNRKRKCFMIPFFIVMLAALVLIIGLWNGASSFGEAYWQALLFLEVMNIYDGVVIDKLWVGHSQFWVLPGLEDDQANVNSLQREISSLDADGKLKQIQFFSKTIDIDSHRSLLIPKNVPVLSFVDPFGYKGLTRDLINKLIANSGSDCIFFFNYNRINMALSSNTKFDDHLIGIFGEERTKSLKTQLASLSPSQREPIVINALIEALIEDKGNYVLPFKFYSAEILRTSHFIVFVTKNNVACKIMKQIMYSNSAKDNDGVATFSFEDSRNFTDGFSQLSIFDGPIKDLEQAIISKYSGRTVTVQQLCDEVDCDFTNQFVSKNVTDILKRMEHEGQITVISGRKQKMRNGVLNMPQNAIIRFR